MLMICNLRIILSIFLLVAGLVGDCDFAQVHAKATMPSAGSSASIERWYRDVDGADWQPALHRAIAANVRFIRFSAGKHYRFRRTTPLPSGMVVEATGATIIAESPGGTLFNLRDTTNVRWNGGTIDGNLKARVAHGLVPNLKVQTPAFRFQNTQSIILEGITFKGGFGQGIAVKGVDLNEREFSSGILKNIIFRDGSGFFAYGLRDFSWIDCRQPDPARFFIAVNVDSVPGAVLRGLSIIRPYVRGSIRIPIEIKRSEGLIIQDADIDGAAYMGISLPDGRGAHVSGRIAHVTGPYGLELVGEVSGARVDVAFKDIAKTGVMINLSDYGHGNDIRIDGSFVRTGLAVSMFRPQRVTQVGLAAVSAGALARGDRLWIAGAPSFDRAAVASRAIVVGVDAPSGVLYLERAVRLGWPSVAIDFPSGTLLTNGRNTFRVTLPPKSQNGAGIPALSGWSRAVGVVYAFSAIDSGLVEDHDSGPLRATYSIRASFSRGAAHKAVVFRGEQAVFDNLTYRKASGAVAGESAFVAGAGATTPLFRNVMVEGNGALRSLIKGCGKFGLDHVRHSGLRGPLIDMREAHGCGSM